MIFFNELYIGLIFLSSLLFWTIVPESMRTKFIIATSFAALAFIQLKFSIFLIGLILLVFWGGKTIERQQSFRKLRVLIVILVTVLLVFKYGKLFFGLIFSSENELTQKYMIPLGISYLIFKLIAYIIDIYRGTIKNPKLDELMAFIFFIPSFPAGPIEKFQNFSSKRLRHFDSQSYISGLQRLTIGYFKKVVIVNFALNEIVMKHYYPIIIANGDDFSLSAPLILTFLIGALLYAYFDLSGYADIAIGFGQLFGYKICENMNYPIFQKNISDYWNCWHISLSHWCRDNVYFPVLGKTRNNVIALFCSFLVMGLWHHVNFNWACWGMWHATGVTVFSRWTRIKRKHKFLKKLLPGKISFIFGMILTFLFASLGYSFIMMDNIRLAFLVLINLFI